MKILHVPIFRFPYFLRSLKTREVELLDLLYLDFVILLVVDRVHAGTIRTLVVFGPTLSFESVAEHANDGLKNLHVQLSVLAQVVRNLPLRVFDVSVLQEELWSEILLQKAQIKLPALLEALDLLVARVIFELLDVLRNLSHSVDPCSTLSTVATLQQVALCVGTRTK